MLSRQDLAGYRARTFRLERPVKTLDEAVAFINERGYVFFWPITGIPFPSLWTAAAGDRPVADAHDDPGHITWGWKDELLGQKRIYYTRMLRKKNTMISMKDAPYFYALTPNYGSPEEDYLTQYEMGQITMETRNVYEALLKEGPLDTISLRKKTHLTGPGSDSRFNRALESLQVDMRILPVGVARAGAWHYAFVYDCVHRHLPEVIERSAAISEKEARLCLLALYFRSMGAAPLADVTKMFQWPVRVMEQSLGGLATRGEIACGLEMENGKGEWVGLKLLNRI
jgi:hypothetical protein